MRCTVCVECGVWDFQRKRTEKVVALSCVIETLIRCFKAKKLSSEKRPSFYIGQRNILSQK